VNAPPWFSALLSALMLFLAGYSLWRLLISRAWGRATDYDTDVLHLVAGIAVAGMISSWMPTLPRGTWFAAFACGGIYLVVRARYVWTELSERRRLLEGAACCAVLIYMVLAGVAPSTLSGSTAGEYTMAGMPGMIADQTITYPTIGLIFVVGLAFGSVLIVNRVDFSLAPRPAPTIGGPNDGAPATDILAPRTVQLCRVLLLLVLAYTILSKLV
jgi:hypothetical protein